MFILRFMTIKSVVSDGLLHCIHKDTLTCVLQLLDNSTSM